MNTTDKLFRAALAAASPDDKSAIAFAAAELARTKQEYGDEGFHNALGVLATALETDFKHWLKQNSPEETDPDRSVYLYQKTLSGFPHAHLASDHFYRLSSSMRKLVLKAISSQRSSGRKDEKARVTSAYHQYPKLLAEIRAAKIAWDADDKRIRGTENFRMMGGLSRFTSLSSRYSQLVSEAQRLEKSVLGKVLTPHAKAAR